MGGRDESCWKKVPVLDTLETTGLWLGTVSDYVELEGDQGKERG